jgi:V8-like Glu-specific endopeptidase
MRARTLLSAAIALLMSATMFACQSSHIETSTSENEIFSVGSTLPDQVFSGACHMYIVRPPDDDMDPQDDLQCTCSLIAPTVILTAASCVHDTLEINRPEDIVVTFGQSVMGGDIFSITEWELHRYYDDDVFGVNDLAVLRLDGDPTLLGYEAVTLNEEALTQDDLGTDANIVGYGVTGVDNNDFGTRRKAVTPITVVDPRNVFAGVDTETLEETSCDGDSGGPVFADLGSGMVQIGVTSLHDQEGFRRCFANIQRTRVDTNLTDFIHPYIDRFHGNCPIDMMCDMQATCRSVDPDCEPCAWGNGMCEEDCSTRDWDCELGTFLGGACTADGQCEEGGYCIEASDEPAFTYCTRPCDPADEESCPDQMNAEMECTDTGMGGGECEYVAPSPGSQGYSCQFATDCRSGICEETICVNPCDSGNCPDPFVCGPSTEQPGTDVCLGAVLSGGGGFCTVAPAGGSGDTGSNAGSMLLLLAAMFGSVEVFRRRRRRD